MKQTRNYIQHEFLDCLIGYLLIPEEREGVESDVGEFGLEFLVDDEFLEYFAEAVADFSELFVVLGLCLLHADLAAQLLHELDQFFLLLLSLLQYFLLDFPLLLFLASLADHPLDDPS